MMVASDHLISCPVSMACSASAEFMGLAVVRALYTVVLQLMMLCGAVLSSYICGAV